MRSMQASTEDYRRKREHRIVIVRSIWPTGTTRHVSLAAAQRAVDMADAEAWCARPSAAAVRSAHAAREQLRAITQAEHVVAARTRGIAEGRRLAAQRMERFVAWLRSEGLTGLAMLSSAHLSPEAATMESIEAGCRWPFKAAGIAWDEAWLREARGACDFALMGRRVLASPEWAALPWQREAGR